MERASVNSIFLFTLFSFFFFIFNNFLQGTFIERITVVNVIASNTFTEMSYRLDIVIYSLYPFNEFSPWFDSLVSSQRCFDLWFLSKQYPFSIVEFSPTEWNLFMFILRWIWYISDWYPAKREEISLTISGCSIKNTHGKTKWYGAIRCKETIATKIQLPTPKRISDSERVLVEKRGIHLN